MLDFLYKTQTNPKNKNTFTTHIVMHKKNTAIVREYFPSGKPKIWQLCEMILSNTSNYKWFWKQTLF